MAATRGVAAIVVLSPDSIGLSGGLTQASTER